MIRRRMLQTLATASALCHLPKLSLWAQATQFPGERRATLRALAGVLIPASLGPDFAVKQTDRFTRWVQGYRPNAEMEHGYGFTRLRNTPPHPGPRYAMQLEELDQTAQLQHKKPFAELSLDARRQIVESAMGAAKVDSLPAFPGASHVTVDMLAHFFRSSEANDLCFEAQIGRDACNGFAGVGEQPRRLQRRNA